MYLDSFMTEEVPESENEKNKVSTLYLKCDFSLPVMVPLLEMGRSFPVLVNCVFGYLHLHFFLPWKKRFILLFFFHLKVLSPILEFRKKIIY